MSSAGDRLRLNPAVVLAPADEGYLAFDTESEQLHTLNPGAALVVELCDRARGLDAVREALLPVVGGSGWTACQQWLETARRSRLLVPAATGRRTAPSANDLASLAASLLDRD